MSSDWEPLLELATHSLQLARAFGDEVNELHARVTFGTALCGAGQEVAGLAELREALERGRLLGEDELVARAYNNLVVALRESPDMDPALLETTMREALEWLDEPTRTEGAHLTGARTNVAWAALDRGAWEVADQALDALRVDDLQGIDRADYLSARAALSWARGRLDDAMEDANSILGLGLDDFWDNHVAHLVTARVAAERSQVAQVRRTVDRALSMRGTHRHLNGRVAEMRLLRTLIRAEVDAAMQAKAPDLARLHDAFTQIRELHHLLTAEEAVTWPSTRAHAARELRLAEAERDRVDGPSPASWQAVLEVGGIAAYDRVYARWRLAEALLDAGDRARGTAELRAANHEAVTLGAELLAEHVVRTAAHYELDPTATAADG